MNIVLATPPDLEGRWGAGSFPPLGLLYLATCVEDLPNVRVRIVDAYAQGLGVDEALERILVSSPDVVGISPTSMTFAGAWELLKRLKAERPQVVTAVGGLHATLFDRLLLREISELDFVFRGEAEFSFREFCSRLIEGRDPAGIAGLSYRSQGRVVSSDPQVIADLDALPVPNRKLLDFDGYGTQWAGVRLPKLPRFASLVTSRGCSYRCTFCSDKILPQSHWRPRSAENVFEELRLIEQSGYDFALIVDENFSGSVKRVNTLCRMMLEHGLKLRFAVQCSLHNVPDSTMRLMHQAGCDVVFLGVETGSDAQLRRYNKPANRQGMAAGIRRARRSHMIVVASFITGAPGETLSDLEATKQFVLEVRPHFCETGPLRIHPGSRLWEEMVGTSEPGAVEGTFSRRTNTFPGQVDRDTIDEWLADFRRTYRKTLFDWRVVTETISLLRHNPTVRRFVWIIVKNPRLLLEFARVA